MKQVLMTVAAVITLTACSNNDSECCSKDTDTVKIMGIGTHDTVYLSDSVALNNMLYADSLMQLDTSVAQ